MATITCLPIEVLNIILCDESISIKDILNLTFTCKQFYNLTNNNTLWRKKFYQRWPYLREEYEELYKKSSDFFEHIKTGIKYKQKLWHYMSLMPEKYYYKDDLFDSDFKDFPLLCYPNRSIYFFINELIKLLAQSSMEYDLTQKYYAKKILSYLHHYRLRKKWHEFINYPKQQQILEQAATILAQWFQPQKYVSYSYVKTSLDNIVQQVLEHLKGEYPVHPIFSISAEQFFFWKHNNFDDNYWNSIEERQIIESLCKVLYDKLHFSENLSEFILQNSFIDYVLKNKSGTLITLATIYNIVARRLGIYCHLTCCVSYIFFCWRARFDFKGNECAYIDELCQFIQLERDSNNYRIIKESSLKLMLRIMNLCMNSLGSRNGEDLITQRSFLEFVCLTEPCTTEIKKLIDIYRNHHVNLSVFIDMLKKIKVNYKFTNPIEAERATEILYSIRNCINFRPCNGYLYTPFYEIIPKQRTEIKFSVGMIVVVINYNYDYIQDRYSRGVIIGWNNKMDIEYDPYYMVLCENDKTCYVAEGDLKLCIGLKQINHSLIGRYFCKFEKTYYVPNKILAKHYPYDKPNDIWKFSMDDIYCI